MAQLPFHSHETLHRMYLKHLYFFYISTSLSVRLSHFHHSCIDLSLSLTYSLLVRRYAKKKCVTLHCKLHRQSSTFTCVTIITRSINLTTLYILIINVHQPAYKTEKVYVDTETPTSKNYLRRHLFRFEMTKIALKLPWREVSI